MDFGFDVNDPGWWSALLQVIVIDITLAGDNAVVIGMAAAGVAAKDRARVIFFGLAAAVVMRIGFAVVATELLQIIGLLLAGGILLLWVSWRLFRDLREQQLEDKAADVLEHPDANGAAGVKSVRTAVVQIALADASMSLDNVLAVAGAAMHHTSVLLFGLALSIALMGAAATIIARLLQRYHWIGYIGLGLIVIVASRMIWEGAHQIAAAAGG